MTTTVEGAVSLLLPLFTFATECISTQLGFTAFGRRSCMADPW
jgi:hypothetical protein